MIHYKNVLDRLVTELNGLDHKFPSLIKKAEKGLELATKAKIELDQLLIKNGFQCIRDEISFFKSLNL